MTVIPMGQIQWIVSRMHVSTTEAEIETEMRRRMPTSRFSASQIDEGIRHAMQCHRENVTLYHNVQQGTFNASSSRADGTDSVNES